MTAKKTKKSELPPQVPDSATIVVAHRLGKFADDKNKKHRIHAHGAGSLVVHRGVSISTALAESIADLLEKNA